MRKFMATNLKSLIGKTLTVKVDKVTKGIAEITVLQELEDDGLHPEGYYEATIKGFGDEWRESKTKDYIFIRRIDLLTEHGSIFGTLIVGLNTMGLMRAMESHMIGKGVNILVRHKVYPSGVCDSRKIAEISFVD